MREGVIGRSLDVDSLRYFDIHYTPADTLHKIDPNDLVYGSPQQRLLSIPLLIFPDPCAIKLGRPSDKFTAGRYISISQISRTIVDSAQGWV